VRSVERGELGHHREYGGGKLGGERQVGGGRADAESDIVDKLRDPQLELQTREGGPDEDGVENDDCSRALLLRSCVGLGERGEVVRNAVVESVLVSLCSREEKCEGRGGVGCLEQCEEGKS